MVQNEAVENTYLRIYARQGEIGPHRRGGRIAVEEVKQRLYTIQPDEGATKRKILWPTQLTW